MRCVFRLVLLAAAMLPCSPFAAAQSAARDPLVLVVNRAPKVLSVFKADGPSLTLLKTVPVGNGAREICVAPDGKRAYVSNQQDGSVTVVDLDTIAVVATIADPRLKTADGGIVSADSKKVYVTSAGNDTVVVIDAATGKVVKDIATGRKGPRRVIFAPDGKRMYVGHNNSDELAVIDMAAEKVVKHIKVGNECRGGFGFVHDGKLLLNNSVEDDTMYYIDTATDKVVKIIGVPFSPQRIAVTPKGTVVCLSGGQGRAVTVMSNLDRHDGTRMVPVGDAAWDLALNNEGTISYSSNYKDGTLTIIDLTALKVLRTMPVGDDPNGVAFRPGSRGR